MVSGHFFSEAISPWMQEGPGPEGDIALSTRIRLARNVEQYPFPVFASEEASATLLRYASSTLLNQSEEVGSLEALNMNELRPNERQVLVEKHLVSPYLIKNTEHSAVLLNNDESISIMVNEEDHLRLQCLSNGMQLEECYNEADRLDDWAEANLTYAFDERLGYLTSCPTNVGTGMRASVMVHLPALVWTNQLSRILPAIHQLGLVVRGIYGEGSEALGNLFQISNQMTLGKSEKDIIEDLRGVVMQVIQRERHARESLLSSSKVKLEDRVFRSYGILAYSRTMTTKEAANRLSDVRLGIDLDLIKGISGNILNELMLLTQSGFLEQYAGESLNQEEADIRRANVIRERIKLEL